jgi:hypothetical protein
LQNLASATIQATNFATSLAIDTGTNISNAGHLDAINGATLTIEDAVTNTGNISANGGNVAVYGNVAGLTGKLTIASGNQLELRGGSNQGIATFMDGSTDNGTLILDFSGKHGTATGFTGTVAGFYYDSTHSDQIVLQDIKLATASWSFIQNIVGAGAKGTLTVQDGSGDKANITLMGHYLAVAGDKASSGTGSTLFGLHTDNITNTTGTLVTTTFHP